MANTEQNELTMLRESALDFTRQRTDHKRLRAMRETTPGYDKALVGEMAGMGWNGILIPEAHGGLGLQLSAMAVVLEELGRGLIADPLVATTVLGGRALQHCGNEALKEKLLPKIADGSLVATLAVDEHLKVVDAVVKRADKRVAVIAGTGANSTREAIELTHEAARLGVDSALSVVPYYNRPTQEGMYLHFKAIAEACDLPVILYNVPGRTVADMSNDTALRLADIPNIIGIKEATGNLERACDLVRRAPADFALYTGDDASAMAFMLCGGHGVISVTANVAPKLMSEL